MTVAIGWAIRRGIQTSIRFKGAVSLVLGVAFGLASLTALAMPLSVFLQAACAASAYVLGGACLVQLLCAWVQAYARLRGVQGFLYLAVAVCLGCVPIAWFTTYPPATAMGVFLAACAVASSLGLVALGSHASHVARPHRAAGPSDEKPVDEGEKPAGSDAEPGVLRAAFCPSGLAVTAAFALCFVSWGIMAIPPDIYVHEHNPWVALAGSLLALGAAFAFARALKGDYSYAAVRTKAFFSLPVLIVFVAYFSFNRMLDANGAFKLVLSVGWNFSASALTVLALGLCACICREKGVVPERAALPLVVFAMGGYVVGVGTYEALGEHAMYVQVVLSTGYLVAVALFSAWQGSLDGDRRLQRECAAFADRYGLSERELDILLLVAADYSSESIASRLLISKETVRTHRKRIYAKAGVHKREELLLKLRSGE